MRFKFKIVFSVWNDWDYSAFVDELNQLGRDGWVCKSCTNRQAVEVHASYPASPAPVSSYDGPAVIGLASQTPFTQMVAVMQRRVF